MKRGDASKLFNQKSDQEPEKTSKTFLIKHTAEGQLPEFKQN